MTDTTPPSSLFDTFCTAFGPTDAVRAEIEAFWRNSGGFSPVAVYNHLVDTHKGQISSERAEFLKAYFAESFEPEHTTGYCDKHREPLITAFAEAYTNAQPQAPVFRVEGDVMNLGGLNAALEKEFIAKATAQANGAPLTDEQEKEAKKNGRLLSDAVIRVMTTILKQKLEGVGEVAPIRSGGDELTLYVRPTTDRSGEKGINDALKAAEEEIATFVKTIGLRNLKHLKEGKKPGVGIGCAVTPLLDASGNLKSDVTLSDTLENGIKEAKKAFNKMLGEIETPDPTQDPANLIDQIGKQIAVVTITGPNLYARMARPAPPPAPQLLAEDSNFTGNTPEEARHSRAKRNFPKAEGRDPQAEQKLLDATVDLTARTDFVTGLPQFGAIERVIAPNFRAHFGDNARVVHIDISNVGGGNDLGSWVANAMLQRFTQCVTDGIKAAGYENYLPYLTSQGGGKFTLLVPQGEANEARVGELTDAIEHALAKVAEQELQLNEEQKDASRPRLFAQHNKRVEAAKKRGETITSSNLDAGLLSIANINHAKGDGQGSHIVVTSTQIDLAKQSVIAKVGEMEPRARAKQGEVASDRVALQKRDAVRPTEEKGGIYRRYLHNLPPVPNAQNPRPFTRLLKAESGSYAEHLAETKARPTTHTR